MSDDRLDDVPANALEDKVFGCLAAAQVGSALAVPVEGWDREDILEEYDGELDFLDSWEYGDYEYQPGTTEDGIERMKLQVLSIVENGGPITSRDLAETWLKYVNEESFGHLAQGQDEIHFNAVEAGLPPEEAGRYDQYVGRVGPHRASHANGLVNAGQPALAAKYAIDVARIYQPPTGRGVQYGEGSAPLNYSFNTGLDWSGAICAGIAEAVTPASTVDSVIDAATAHVVEQVAEDVETAVEVANEAEDYEDLHERFAEIYNVPNSKNHPLARSNANEVVPKGFALFAFFEGDVYETLVGATNFGRDTDCLTAVAAGLAGAFSGSDGIPDEWIARVDEATQAIPDGLTVSRMTLQEQARGVYEALEATLEERRSGDDALCDLRETSA